MSQYEGFFGQLSFQTANFLGRGESLTASAQAGSRSQNYQLSFTEPFLFDRNLTGGIDVYKRSLQYIGYYTQKSTGGNLTFGFPVADFARMFINYSYESVGVADLNEALLDPSCVVSSTGCSTINVRPARVSPSALRTLQQNPFLRDAYLPIDGNRRSARSRRATCSTHRQPIFRPRQACDDGDGHGGLGGNKSYLKPTLEGIWYHPHTSRSSWRPHAVPVHSAVSRYDGAARFERLSRRQYSVRGYESDR